jgi:diaminopimelate epimerase
MEVMAAQSFEKYEGLGNDFILVPTGSEESFDRATVPQLCDRRFGVGADGVLLILPSGDHAARMRVLNADGSVPEMCGNGLRCVALFVAERLGLSRGELAIETDAGVRGCVFERGGDGGVVDVDMGVVRAVGKSTLSVAGEAIELTLADAGNPHAIAYRTDLVGDLATIGPIVATHPTFARGTNVELVRWHDGVIEVAVWERGVGRTLACGTGACAVVAVACERGEAKSGAPVRVRLPGGELLVTHDAPSGLTRMKGPARRVFRGDWVGPA